MTKVSKKRVLKKAVLLYNWSKKYYIKSWKKRKIATQKTDYLFDTLAISQTDKQTLQLYDKSYNYESVLSRTHSTY